ncbi:hypothetical protein ACFL9U_07045 [Thermodesulfobacteriota bacterium]
MSEILRRLTRIAKSYLFPGTRGVAGERVQDEFSSFEEREAGSSEAGYSYDTKNTGKADQTRGPSSAKPHPVDDYPGIPKQVVEDLAVFDLTPPSSLKAVRAARNREIKKYHSDRFMNDREKFETSKQIMQIYNAAYDRLEEYFKRV